MPSLQIVEAVNAVNASAEVSATASDVGAMTPSLQQPPPPRRVTPLLNSTETKKRQQKKVNQMTLSNFFHSNASSKGKGKADAALAKKKTNVKTTSSDALDVAAASTTASASASASAPNKGRKTFMSIASESKLESKTLSAFSSGHKRPLPAETLHTSAIPASTWNANAPPTTDTLPSLGRSQIIVDDENHNKRRSTRRKKARKSLVEDTTVLSPTGKKSLQATATANTKESPVNPSVPAPSTNVSSAKSVASPNVKAKKKKITSPSTAAATAIDAPTTNVTPPSAMAMAPTLPPLSEERKSLLQQHRTMMQQCQRRSQDLVQGVKGRLDEEDFEMPSPERQCLADSISKHLNGSDRESGNDTTNNEDFPDVVVNNMALLLEGSSLPLSELAKSISERLHECHSKSWPIEVLKTKIKLMAERKAYLNPPTSKEDPLFKYEDNSLDRMWRWEVGILEVLPTEIRSKVRKARTARRKVLQHFLAIDRLSKSIQAAESHIRDTSKEIDFTATTTGAGGILSKISKDEEKVLKFEREAEKQRLVQLVKKKKDQEAEAKKREKERKKEELERKRIEKEREKQEALDAKEAEKRKRQKDKNRANQSKLQQEEKKKEAAKKQKACLMSFFAKPKEEVTEGKSDTLERVSNAGKTTQQFDDKKFRDMINSQQATPKSSCPLFPALSKDALHSRMRRTHKVPVSVYVTVMPEGNNAFEEQPFAEQKIFYISNKYRFLSFHEDYRPAYHGTWSKRSSLITGKTPFGKDLTYLDYEYDSEAEWEEGDDEIGEDVDDDTKNQEEEEEDTTKVYDYEDGFCVADDQYLDIDEGVDEETKALYRKKLQRGDSDVVANRICIVGPQLGGLPANDTNFQGEIEGFQRDEIIDLFKSHEGKQLSNPLLWLDAFAPDKIDEIEPTTESEKPNISQSNKDEYSIEEMKILVSFAHLNTLNSKEKLVEELRNANPNLFDSRAKVVRKLDSVAIKKKQPHGTGVYWEVNKEILENLALDKILAKKLPPVEIHVSTEKDSAAEKKRKLSEVTKKSKTQTVKLEAVETPSSVICNSVSHSKMKKQDEKSVQRKASPNGLAVITGSTNVSRPSEITTGITNFLQPRKKPKLSSAAN